MLNKPPESPKGSQKEKTPLRQQVVDKKKTDKEKVIGGNKNRRRDLNDKTANVLTGKKEAKEKKKSYFMFPGGLKLEVARDKDSAKEWRDSASTPLECFKKKFKGKSLKDIDKDCLKWVLKGYRNNLPIVRIRPRDLDKKISKYFRVRDLVKIDGKDKEFMVRAGTWAKHEKFMIHDVDGQYYWNVARIDPNLCRILDGIRSAAGFQIKIDEGVRPYAYNRDMYIAKYGKRKLVGHSPHVSGRAVDMSRTGNEQNDAKLKAAIKASLRSKGGGFGYGATVYHVDTKIQNGKKGQEGNWVVSKKTGKIVLRTRKWPY